MVLQSGDQVGPYQIEELLGTGGMATVYRAHHSRLDRHVAIKVMHPQLLADDNFLARFEREAKVIARLDHPNIIQIYDYSEHERQPYLVMKYVDGATLKNRLRDEPMALDEIRRVMGTLAGALDYAHAQGVLHRDLKPSNIIIGQDDTPYITDFGLARITQSGESTMSADMMLGTPQYISPEQAQGAKDIDARTDLYSFGIILYELLVGRVPFSADTAYATVHEQIYTPPPMPSVVNPEITPLVEGVLLKALAKSPADRYPTAKALMRALEDALEASNLRTLDPSRVEKAVPVQFTPSPIPPAVKEREANPGPSRSRPAQPDPLADPLGFAGQVMDEALRAAGGAFDEAFSGTDDPRSRRDVMRDRRNARRETRRQRGPGRPPAPPAPPAPPPPVIRNRMTWARGTEWRQDGAQGPGFYTYEEIAAAEAALTDEQRIRKRVEKRLEERNSLFIHGATYFFINLMLFAIWLGSSIEDQAFDFPWFLLVLLPWGIGLFAHYTEYQGKYGAGRDRREAMIREEMDRERSRVTGVKAKNDDLYAAEQDRERRVRLTEDGELSTSFIEELDEAKRKRQS